MEDVGIGIFSDNYFAIRDAARFSASSSSSSTAIVETQIGITCGGREGAADEEASNVSWAIDMKKIPISSVSLSIFSYRETNSCPVSLCQKSPPKLTPFPPSPHLATTRRKRAMTACRGGTGGSFFYLSFFCLRERKVGNFGIFFVRGSAAEES